MKKHKLSISGAKQDISTVLQIMIEFMSISSLMQSKLPTLLKKQNTKTDRRRDSLN
jgi:hypothetical protein